MMEENKENREGKTIIEGEKVENTNTTTNSASNYTTVREIKSKKESHFGRNVVLPFFSGIVGTAVVLGTCFGVPSIRESILGSTNNSHANQNTASSDISVNANTNLVSLANYSETGVGVAAKVRPSVVGIRVEYSVSSPFYSGTSSASAEGSGIIMTEDGYILTNNHIVNSTSSSSFYVLGEASKVTVYLYEDETPYEATIIGTDDQTDLAVLKIDKTGLTPVTIGDSSSVQVGEFAMAVGNPLGLESSVSAGIVSAVNREVTTDGVTYTLIQTDTAINSGNSGGALVNSNGELIGINTLKLSGEGVEGMGFAIPINIAKPVYDQLVEYQKVKRPYIGITGQDLTEQLAKENNLVVGIYVKAVDDFSAAEKAGIKPGDVIIAADGKNITTMDELTEIKNSHNIGDQMTIKVNRNGMEKELTVTLQEQ